MEDIFEFSETVLFDFLKTKTLLRGRAQPTLPIILNLTLIPIPILGIIVSNVLM